MKRMAMLLTILAFLAASNAFAFGAIAVDDEEGEGEGEGEDDPGYCLDARYLHLQQRDICGKRCY